MFMNVAYLNNSTSTVVDNTKPLIVTSCGNYRVKNRSEVVTHRPKGRKDYQLLYIASGKGHFFIHGEEKTVSAGNIIIYLPDQPQEYVYYRADRSACTLADNIRIQKYLNSKFLIMVRT